MDENETWDLALGETYKKMYNRLLRYAEMMMGQPSLAEEAVQESFRIACVKHEEFLASESREGWIMRTLQYVIRNEKRKRERLNRLVAASYEHGGDVFAAAGDDYSGIEYEGLIPPEDLRLLKRIAVDRYSVREAADELNISVEACKKRVQRARNRLRARLAEIENDADPQKAGRGEGEVRRNV